MRKVLKKFLGENLGSVAIEFSLVLPLYILILSSAFELTMYALLQNKIQRLCSVMADTVSRQTISRVSLQGLLSQAGQFTTPFNFANAKITVSQIRNEDETNDPANMIISWQESFQGDATRLGSPGASPSEMPNNYTVLNDQTVIVAEIIYDYSSFIFASLIGSQTLYSIYLTPPRGGTMNNLLGE